MSIHYSPARDTFFDASLHPDLPADAVKVSADDHATLLQARTAGMTITIKRGRPVAVQPIVPVEQRRAVAVQGVKAEAGRRILATASLIQQANDNAAIAMAALASSAGVDGDPAANAIANAAIDRRQRIDAIRAASNQIEAAIATMSVRSLAALDVTADHHWPA